MCERKVARADRSSVDMVSAPNWRHLESSDDYPAIVTALDPRTRVIAADIQWIIQIRRSASRNSWRGKYHFRSKEGLLFFAPKPAAPELLALPDWFPDPALRAARRPPALAMPARPITKRQPQVKIDGPLFVKKSEDGSFAVAAASTGIIVKDGIDSAEKADSWREGMARPRRARAAS